MKFKSVFAYFLLALYVWSYGHAMGTHNIVFDLQSHEHNHDGVYHSHENEEANHHHADESVVDLIFCALTEYGHFLWDIEHGEHGIHYSLGLNSSDLLKGLADGSGIIPVNPYLSVYQIDFSQAEVKIEPEKIIELYLDLRSIDLVHKSPFRGPPILSC